MKKMITDPILYSKENIREYLIINAFIKSVGIDLPSSNIQIICTK